MTNPQIDDPTCRTPRRSWPGAAAAALRGRTGRFVGVIQGAGLSALLTAGVMAGVIVLARSAFADSVIEDVAGDVPAGYVAAVAEQAASALSAEVGVSHAEARQRLRSQARRQALGERLTNELGVRAAGSWLDQKNDTVVVNVLDSDAAVAVRQAGAVPKQVSRAWAELVSLQDRLVAYAVVNTAVGLDVPANQVVLTVSSAASEEKLSDLLAEAERLGSAVRVERVSGAFDLFLRGGDAIYGGGSRCSAGFNVTGGGILTAGHCTAAITSWTVEGGASLGPTTNANFPDDDFGRISNTGGVSQPGEINLYDVQHNFQVVTGSGNPFVNQSVCKSGSTTGLTCGSVQYLNVTVNYVQGTVYGLTQSDACARPGDSGGSWFDGGTALGLTSGGVFFAGECTTPAMTFFQPIQEALEAYGVNVVVGNQVDQAPVPIRPVGPVEGPRPTFEWEPVPYATRYRVVVTVEGERVIDRTVPGTTLTPGWDLQIGVEHLWTVRGVDDFGRPGPESDPVSFTPIPVYTEPPDPPVLLAPEHCIATLTPTFTWLPAARAADYKIAIWRVAPESLVVYQATPDTSFTPDYAHIAFEAGQEYRWWVKARNSKGERWSQQMFYFTPSLSCAPAPAIAVSDVTVSEGSSGATLASFTLTLSEASAGTVSVSYATASGTATAGSDFVSTSGQASFDPGVTSRTVDVPVVADTLGEPTETFSLDLSNPINASLADAQGLGTIVDDDATTETPLWTRAVGVATLPGGGLSKLGGDGWVGAVTQKGIMGQRGQMLFTATETNTTRLCGFGYRFTGSGPNELDFAIQLGSDGSASVYESGVELADLGPYATGDVFNVVVRIGLTRYFRNGVLAWESAQSAPVRPLRGQALLYSAGATLGDTTLIGAQVRVEDVTFENQVGVAASGNNLSKTAATAWGNAGATSRETLVSGEGFVEAVADETTTTRMFGLSHLDNPSYTDIDFAIQLSFSVGGRAYVHESGAFVLDLGPYVSGDRFRVSVKSGIVEYSKNGMPVYTSTRTPSFPLHVDSAFYDQGATLKDVILSGLLSPEDVTWANLASVRPAGNGLVDAQPGATPADAQSAEGVYLGPGMVAFLEFEASETTTSRVVGLSDPDVDAGPADVELGIHLSEDGQAYVVESRDVKADLGPYRTGDRFRIVSDSRKTVYTKVGASTSSYVTHDPARRPGVRRADASLATPGATVRDVVLTRPFVDVCTPGPCR